MIEINLIGYLGADCSTADFSGKTVINFTVAVSIPGKDGTKTTQWVKCAYWRENAKDAIKNYLKKGTHVFIKGTPGVESYTDKNTGELKCLLKVTVFSLHLLGSKDSAPAPHPSPGVTKSVEPIPDSDLPF